jgi:uncharacterized membrane protein
VTLNKKLNIAVLVVSWCVAALFAVFGTGELQGYGLIVATIGGIFGLITWTAITWDD